MHLVAKTSKPYLSILRLDRLPKTITYGIFAAGFYSNLGFFTTATTTKPSSSNSFLTYENNCTLGIKIQYPANWQRDSYNNKVAFFAPSLDNPKIIPNTKYTI